MSTQIPAKRLLPAAPPLNAHDGPSDNNVTLPGRSEKSYRESASPHQKQKRIACRDCRQAKLKCDRGNVSGQVSCSRCRRLSLECQVDSDYKRVNKRTCSKLDELAEQVERLSSAVGQAGGSHPFLGSPEDVGQMVNIGTAAKSSSQTSLLPQQLGQQHINDRNLRQPGSSHIGGKSLSRQEDLGHSSPSTKNETTRQRDLNQDNDYSKSLDDIELDYHAISCLFFEFFENYHHFLEILDPSISPSEYYDRSPLLFWCIICVAARRYKEDATLLAVLSPSVIRLMWSTVSILPHSRHTVQALILVSVWSFPINTMSKDLSFMVVSLAKSACMQLGLHRPETVQDFLRVRTTFGPQEFQEAVKIWAGCFIAAQSVTASAGQPSMLSSDWAIDQACEVGNMYTLPENLRSQLLIYKFIARVNKVMTESDRSPTGYPPEAESYVLMTMLEADFSTLERQINCNAISAQSILLSMACVQLRTYYFFMSSGTDVRKQGLLKAYAAAVTLISKAAEADETWNFTQFAPSGFIQVLTIAAMMLMKIVNSSYARYIDTEEGKRTFNTAISLLRKSSVEDNDLQGRVNKIIAQLWNLHRNLNLRKEGEPTVHIKTRWGASLLHDSLWMWREEFGGQKAPPPNLDATASTSPSSSAPIFADPSLSTPRMTEGWSDRLSASQNQITPLQITPSAITEVPGLDNLMEDLPDLDWIWDIGFPSVMPIDINSYQATDANGP